MTNLENFQILFEETKEDLSKVPAFFETIWSFRSSFKVDEHFFTFLNNVKDWAENRRDTDPKTLALALFTCSLYYFLASKYELSNNCALEAKRIFNELNDMDGNALCLAVIGSNYRSLGAQDLAIQYQMEATAQFRKSGAYKAFQLTSCYQLAELYADSGNHRDAYLLFDELIELAQKAGDVIFLGRAAIGKGNIYLVEKKYDLAFAMLNDALKLSRQSGFQMNISRVLSDLGRYYFEQNDLEKAIEFNK